MGLGHPYPHLQAGEAGGRVQVFDLRACDGRSRQPPLVSPVQAWALPGAGTSPCAGPCVAAQRTQETCCPTWGRWVSRVSWHRLPWAGTSDGRSPSLAAPPSGPWVGRPHYSSIAKQVGAGGRGWPPGTTGSRIGLRRDCWSPHFTPGNRGSSFHLLQNVGPLKRPDGSRDSPFSIPATDSPGVVPMATVLLPGSSGSC